MYRFVIVLLVSLGCASEGIDVVTTDVQAPELPGVRRARTDAGAMPDMIVAAPDAGTPDTLPPPADTRPADTLASPDTLTADLVPAPDTRPVDTTPPDATPALDAQAPIDAIPPSDSQALPDGLSYPHDIVPNATTPCMQQVIDNGYASDKASCATWNIKLNETYIAQHPEYMGPRTSQEACMFIINCFAANPGIYTSWEEQPDCNCTCPIAFGGVDWVPLRDIIAPFCPTFFDW